MKIFLNFALVSTLLVSGTLKAQDFVFDKEKGKAVPTFIGQIKLMKGKVFKKVNEETNEVSTGERFKVNDLVITSEQSFVKIQMIDDSIITIGPKSEMKLVNFDFQDKSNRSMTVELVKGQLGADIKNRAKPGDLNFKTKFTTMGVRGTYFLMNHHSIGNLVVADYAVIEGKVEVADADSNKAPLSKGERMTLIHDASVKKSAKEKIALSSTELSDLNPKINEDEEVKPFLPYLELKDIRSGSPLETLLTQAEVKPDKTKDQEKTEAPKKNWKDSLKKLNEKLRERQKTR